MSQHQRLKRRAATTFNDPMYDKQWFLVSNLYTDTGLCIPSLKSACDIVYPGQNSDVREDLKNSII